MKSEPLKETLKKKVEKLIEGSYGLCLNKYVLV